MDDARRSAWEPQKAEIIRLAGPFFEEQNAPIYAIADGTEAIRLNPNKPLWFQNRSALTI